jgi:hypothetical protein
MFAPTRLVSVAAVAALILSGTATVTIAASDHGKKKVAQVTKPVSKTVSRRSVGSPGAKLDYSHDGPSY